MVEFHFSYGSCQALAYDISCAKSGWPTYVQKTWTKLLSFPYNHNSKQSNIHLRAFSINQTNDSPNHDPGGRLQIISIHQNPSRPELINNQQSTQILGYLHRSWLFCKYPFILHTYHMINDNLPFAVRCCRLATSREHTFRSIIPTQHARWNFEKKNKSNKFPKRITLQCVCVCTCNEY